MPQFEDIRRSNMADHAHSAVMEHLLPVYLPRCLKNTDVRISSLDVIFINVLSLSDDARGTHRSLSGLYNVYNINCFLIPLVRHYYYFAVDSDCLL